MSNSLKAILAVGVLAVVLAVGFIVYTRPHWWYRVGTAEARSPSGPSDPASVYKSMNGELLFVVRADSLVAEYIYYPSSRKIGIPSVGHFTYIPLFAYSNEVPVPVVLSDNKIKVETDMEISVENDKLRFRTGINRQVEADLSKF